MALINLSLVLLMDVMISEIYECTTYFLDNENGGLGVVRCILELSFSILYMLINQRIILRPTSDCFFLKCPFLGIKLVRIEVTHFFN